MNPTTTYDIDIVKIGPNDPERSAPSMLKMRDMSTGHWYVATIDADGSCHGFNIISNRVIN